MSTQTYETEILIKAARAAAETFLATLDESAGTVQTAPTHTADGLIEYDPLHDEPPFRPDPTKSATDAQRRMAAITYLGAIGRINADEGRGATSKEVSEFAKKAGYVGGQAVNGWNSRPSSHRAIENVDGARFLNADGLEWITKDAAKLGIQLVGDIAPESAPK